MSGGYTLNQTSDVVVIGPKKLLGISINSIVSPGPGVVVVNDGILLPIPEPTLGSVVATVPGYYPFEAWVVNGIHVLPTDCNISVFWED